jgi:geranylgeranyl diphosphate synthase type II
MIHALETANGQMREDLIQAMETNPANKVEVVLNIFRACGIDSWAAALKEQYLQTALQHLDEIAVSKSRKSSLHELAHYLISRDK